MGENSREIAELVDSRHDSVKRTIETLDSKAVIVQPQTVNEQSPDSMGRMRATEVYVFSGSQGKRDSLIVVAQLCPEFTAKIVDRWQELETKQAIDPMKALNDPARKSTLLLRNDRLTLMCIARQGSNRGATEPKNTKPRLLTGAKCLNPWW